MGSNRKLIFGAVLLVAGLLFWGLLTARKNVDVAKATPTSLPAAQQTALKESGRMIAYAASNIPQGTLVTKNMIEMRALKGEGPTTPFVTDPEAQAFGYVSSAPIPKGALIRPRDDFAGHISEVGVAGMLRPGTRAIVIPFANKPTLHDLVAIGNLVDVNAAFDGQEARTIVPAVRVLAVDVFGSDFPQVNIARRGAYKADARVGTAASPAPDAAPAAPGTTPTPTPTPAQGGGRPDPAITLEVTPEQANRILLTQASGGVLDFVVLPSRDAVLVGGPAAPNGEFGGGLGVGPNGEPIGSGIGQLISTVTKPQLAPYAERKKAGGAPASGSGAGSARLASANQRGSSGDGGSTRTPRIRRLNNDFSLPPLPNQAGSGTLTPVIPSGDLPVVAPPAAPAESPTYNIPIYADGRTVRVETVQRPQD